MGSGMGSGISQIQACKISGAGRFRVRVSGIRAFFCGALKRGENGRKVHIFMFLRHRTHSRFCHFLSVLLSFRPQSMALTLIARMTISGWRMENGEWRMENGEWAL